MTHIVQSTILIATPILLVLAIAGLMKLLAPRLQTLADKSFQDIDNQSAQPKSTGRSGKPGLFSIKMMVGYILFIVFLQMFSLPLYFIPVFKWEPPVFIVLLLWVMAFLFSWAITSKLMKIVNKNM